MGVQRDKLKLIYVWIFLVIITVLFPPWSSNVVGISSGKIVDISKEGYKYSFILWVMPAILINIKLSVHLLTIPSFCLLLRASRPHLRFFRGLATWLGGLFGAVGLILIILMIRTADLSTGLLPRRMDGRVDQGIILIIGGICIFLLFSLILLRAGFKSKQISAVQIRE